MKSYLSKYQQILILESDENEEWLLKEYTKIFNKVLLLRSIIDSKIYEVANLTTYKISSKPLITEPVICNTILPPFVFLLCKN